MNTEILHRRVMGSKYLRAVFRLAPDAWLVGGYIRDLLSNLKKPDDADFVVSGNAKSLALAIRSKLGGTMVELHDKEDIHRIVLRNGLSLDFSTLEGRPIFQDLASRDLTVNAIAFSPTGGTIDPHNGINDIKHCRIDLISRNNFKDDPLRVLRIYRFCSQTGWRISKRTRLAARECASLLSKPASERITSEFLKLMCGKHVTEALEKALSDNVLSCIIDIENSKLERNVKLVSSIPFIVKPEIQRMYFNFGLSGLTLADMVRLEAILLDSTANRLSLSRKISKHIRLAQSLYSEYRTIDFSDKESVFSLFERAGVAALDLLHLAHRGDLMGDYRRFVKVQNFPLLTSEEISAVSGLGEGRELGRVIRHFKLLYFSGDVRSKTSALKKLPEWVGSK